MFFTFNFGGGRGGSTRYEAYRSPLMKSIEKNRESMRSFQLCLAGHAKTFWHDGKEYRIDLGR